ncbi:hypothetical protein KA183_04500 [bacterium]|nr:hypothetical protein [bacterium]QQR60311.1 MAG: hypothetical protein IPG59_10580 [Candidatus Melainabacteria bacterium]
MKEERLLDSDMQKATAALIRAGKRAKELARMTGTEYVVVRDGQLIQEVPPPLTKKRPKKPTV